MQSFFTAVSNDIFSSENEDSLTESTQPSKKKKSKKEKGTRKNIRKIIDDEKLDERTKEARAAEEERIKRLLQREQRYRKSTENSIFTKIIQAERLCQINSIVQTNIPKYIKEKSKYRCCLYFI